jgi:5-methylcytosine-specific restriction endonuclease McrA
MNTISCTELSDRQLIDETIRAVRTECQSTAALIALLAELDARRLYLGEGSSSLFTYCTLVLRLSEQAAYLRIEAARASRVFPIIIQLLEQGEITLTTVALLRPHLTPDNHQALLTAARHKSKRDVEHQIACLAPRPDAKPLVRRMTTPTIAAKPRSQPPDSGLLRESPAVGSVESEAPPVAPEAASPRARPLILELAPDRYLLKVTLSGETHAKLRRAQDLMRHRNPNGDPAVILDRALALLIEHLERTKLAVTPRPRTIVRSPRGPERSGSRYIPAAIRRIVWARDQARCAFAGPHGRCTETGRLEFHHLIPFAAGGSTTVENLALRCRAHNGHESALRYGPWEQRV